MSSGNDGAAAHVRIAGELRVRGDQATQAAMAQAGGTPGAGIVELESEIVETVKTTGGGV